MLNAYFAEDLILDFINQINSEAIIKNLMTIRDEIINTNDEYKEILNLKSNIEKNNKILQGLIRKFALMDDDIEIVELFKTQIDEVRAKNIELEKQIKELLSKKELVGAVDFDISEFTASLGKFKEFSKHLSVQENRNLLLNLIDHVVWNSEERTLTVNWLKSDSVNPVLCIGDGCRQDHAASS
jgi:site-specific DNA recombinase